MNIHAAAKIASSLITIPEGFEPSFMRNVQHDGESIIWMRFKKKGADDTLGGEHFSVTFNPKTRILKGFIHLENQFETDVVPSENEAEKIAFEFLKKHAPDLAETAEVRWIKPIKKIPVTPPHDEGFTLASGNVITGMRVKLFNPTNQKFGWVISGKNGHVITFERDITWDMERKCRSTERWLHDKWLKAESIAVENGITA